jgi:hypothetical protein
VLPSVEWLDPSTANLGPERILNRALRPLLTVLRSFGLDPFYGGRDLVTVDSRPLACASFSVLPDGVLVVEQTLAWRTALSATPTLLARFDPDAVAAVDATGFEGAASLAELGIADSDVDSIPARLAAAATENWRATASALSAPPATITAARGPTSAAYEAFRAELGPQAANRSCALGAAMLGVVEVTAGLAGGLIHDLEISGDLIAPHATLGALAARLEGTKPSSTAAGLALTELMSDGRNFILGAPDLDTLIGRLA